MSPGSRTADSRLGALTVRPTIRRTSSSMFVSDGFSEATVAPVPEYGDLVSDGKHFTQTVRDVDDGDPLVLEFPNVIEQPFDLEIRNRSGGFVHHEDACVLGQRLGDLDHLPLCDTELPGLRPRIERHTQRIQQNPSPGMHPPMIQHSRPPTSELPAQKDVLSYVEVGNEEKFLEDNGNAQPACIRRRMDQDRHIIDEKLAAIGTMCPTQNLDQRRLAGAVGPEQHVHFAGMDGKGNIVEGPDTGETISRSPRIWTTGTPGRFRRPRVDPP